jgi:hypothetical protein
MPAVELLETTTFMGNAALVGMIVVLLEEDDFPSDERIITEYSGTFVPEVLSRLTLSIEKSIKAFGAKPAFLTRLFSQYVVMRGADGLLVLTESGFLRSPRAMELTALASAPRAVGTPSLVDRGSGYPHVIYRTREGGIARIRASGATWSHEVLPLPPAESSGFTPDSDFHVWTQEGWTFIVYRAGNKLIQMSRHEATGETRTRSLSETTPGLKGRSREVSGDITGYQTSRGHRLLLTHPDGSVTSLRMVTLDSWITESLRGGIPAPAFAPVGVAVGENEFIVFASADGNVHELYRIGSGAKWQLRTITSGSGEGNKAIGAVSMGRFPEALEFDDKGAWVAAWRTERGVCFAERLFGRFRLQALDGFPSAAGDPVVTAENHSGVFGRDLGMIWVHYSSTDLGLQRLMKGTGVPWTHTDLSAVALAAAPASGNVPSIRSELVSRIRSEFDVPLINTDDVIDAAVSLTPLSSLPLGRPIPLTFPLMDRGEGSWVLTAVVTRT